VTTGEDGKLTFDKSRFQAAYAANPDDVQDFFTQDDRGFAIQTDSLLESLVGKDNSLLVNRLDSLQRQVDNYDTDINHWNDRLAKIQDRLLNEFYLMESIVTSIKNNLSAISQIQYISPITSTN